MKVIRIEPNGTCPLPRCDIPMVKVTCATPDGERSFRTHDDGSFDGHPAWVAEGLTIT